MADPDPAAQRQLIEAARKKDRIIGLAIVVLTFALGLGLSWWAKLESRPEVAEPPGPPTTEGLSGYPTNVDPVVALKKARSLTKRIILRGMVAEGVKSDGTIDVSEGPGRARFVFQSPEGQGPQPAREPGTLARHQYCGKQTIHLRTEGLVADPDVSDYPCGPSSPEPLPDPRCTTRDVWAFAMRKGAPRDRLARIEYYRASAGPAWRFELPGTSHHFSLYGDCARELDPREAVGMVP
ncbi:MAG: hypothetical protein KC776_40700 [Myxococcales bacterium]|nr:hypothetical protein [Myxococcales bacterium]MCB9577578.1 hypothetical protein [Polyangiaceae bacterium]